MSNPTDMTPLQLEKRIGAIKETGNDFEWDSEKAHSLEDKLRLDFIKYVSNLKTIPPHVRRKAMRIIRVSKLDFERWCG